MIAPEHRAPTAMTRHRRTHAEDERVRLACRIAELGRTLMSVQEEERRELALVLHDVVSPNLAAIGLNLKLATDALGGAIGEEAQARIEACLVLLHQTARSLRTICTDLRPPALEYGGLLEALENYADQISAPGSLRVRFSGPPAGWRRLPRQTEITLFRVAQEAITNAVKHADATAIDVCLGQNKRRTILAVADDGKGFDPGLLGAVGQKPGIGLLTMSERVECAGGKFTLRSASGQGTRVEVVIPHTAGGAAARS
ncbi:sensor histidine kinase [Aromatoleum evansii]|uniref:sensor histidine kinase n=1 Tax=Aromatoleum evansii TaxID=59406 RepID=UPI00145C427F|nr:sensor histidine kinase [Aromatoleum evansii]